MGTGSSPGAEESIRIIFHRDYLKTEINENLLAPRVMMKADITADKWAGPLPGQITIAWKASQKRHPEKKGQNDWQEAFLLLTTERSWP